MTQEKPRIGIVRVGAQSHAIDTGYLARWKSDLLTIEHAGDVPNLPDSEGPGWFYQDSQLSRLVCQDPRYLFLIAIVSVPLEGNYYSRRLQGNVVVLSLFELGSIASAHNHRPEHLVLRSAYAHLIYCLRYQNRIPVTTERHLSLAHQEIRGCIFDFNAYKEETVKSLDSPVLCQQCRAVLVNAQIPPRFFTTLERELGRIRKDLYYRMAGWVQAHPIWALVAATIASVLINVLSSVLYDALKMWGS